MILDPIQILSILNEEDMISLRKVSGKTEDEIINIIRGIVVDKDLARSAQKLAVMRKHGVNSKEYQHLLEIETRVFKRIKIVPYNKSTN